MRTDTILRFERSISSGTITLLTLLALSSIPACKIVTPPERVSFPCGPNGCPSTESMLADFQLAIIHEDVAELDRMLAPKFVFRFMDQDILSGAPDSLTRAKFLTCAGNLFLMGSAGGDPPATKVTLLMTVMTLEDDNRVGHPGWKKCNANTSLTLTFPDGNQTQVNSPAVFYLVSGSDGWKLAEWQDAPGSTYRPALVESVSHLGAVRALTWGRLLLAYE